MAEYSDGHSLCRFPLDKIIGLSEPDPQPLESVCEVCGQPAELHITNIDTGQVSVRHACRNHLLPPGGSARMPEPMREDDLKHMERRRRGDD